MPHHTDTTCDSLTELRLRHRNLGPLLVQADAHVIQLLTASIELWLQKREGVPKSAWKPKTLNDRLTLLGTTAKLTFLTGQLERSVDAMKAPL